MINDPHWLNSERLKVGNCLIESWCLIEKLQNIVDIAFKKFHITIRLNLSFLPFLYSKILFALAHFSIFPFKGDFFLENDYVKVWQ